MGAGRVLFALALVLAVIVTVLVAGWQRGQAAPPPIKPRPEGHPAALDVFPVEPACFYTNSWGAPRSGGRKHEGVDIIAARGKPIYAVRDGVVNKKYSGAKLAGNGIAIQIKDGTYYFYGHLDRFAEGIRKGSKVKAGDIIGYVGSTGATLVPHLHFEVHPKGGKAVDPTPYVATVDRCGYKGKKLKPIPPSTTTTTTVKPTTTAKPTTTTRPTTTVKATTTTRPTTTVKATTTTAKPTTTAKATTTKPPTTTAKATTTTKPTTTSGKPTSTSAKSGGSGESPTSDATTTTDPISGKYSPADAEAPSIEVMSGLIRPKVRARVQVASTGPLPGKLERADVKIVVSGAKTTAKLGVSDCSGRAKPLVTVGAKKTVTRTVVVPLNSEGKFCLSTNTTVKVEISVRRAWTGSTSRITIVRPVKIFESTNKAKTPDRGYVLKIRRSAMKGLPKSGRSVLIEVTARGGSKDSTVLFGRCGDKRTPFLEVPKGGESTAQGTVVIKGGDLCVSASSPTKVTVRFLAYA